MSILIVGSVALDGIKTPLGECREVLGGSATYSSTSARFFSPDVNIVAVVGKDFPEKHVRFFKKRGIGTDGLAREKGKTFRWEGEYGPDMADARTIATHLNVFADFNPCIPQALKKSKFLFLANIDPDLQDKVLKQIARPQLIVCDTMNYWIEKKPRQLKRLIGKVDVMLLNESEARQLTGVTSVIKAAKSIRKLGARIVIVKKGEHGALLFLKDSIFSAPAYLMESVFDPTGAGDTFAGGFLGYLAGRKRINDAELKKALVYGNIMATFAVEDFSLGRLNSITRKDIEKRFREFKTLTRF
ncbi:MAG: bifunctional hydroxymethylpyrimidine kinase/phosphomethylpyrimidine kinase [Candidatus Omnitrophica bacterium]|nr:bifunctional hydroxymethylpyrimidine kinase/phosphomethylpyrimidine kinase [Candidatus Omnitrophota bacterium]